MVIGIPKEIKPHEYRVSVTPDGAGELRAMGHRVLVEMSAGEISGFADPEYKSAGAELKTREEVFAGAELIVKVKEPVPSEFGLFREGQGLFTFLHLAPNRELVDMLLGKRIAAFAYETLEDGGCLPLLAPMSEIAGRMSPLVAAFYLQRHEGGLGLLATGSPGVRPASVSIIGAGVVGTNAARVAYALGMRVAVLNRGVERLRRLDEMFNGRVDTLPATAGDIEREVAKADIVVGAVLVPGAKAPVVVTRAMVSAMKKGAVMVDVSVDQGGCFETTRPTTHDEPVYELDGVLHYAVTNMPGAYPRTSTMALTNSTLPYVKTLASLGVERALAESRPLRTALNTYEGRIANRGLSESTGLPLMEVS